MHKLFYRIAAPAFLVSAALAGCASTPKVVEPPPRLDPDVAIEQANTFVNSGQNALAFEVLDRAARDNPVSAKPWLRKAQLQFDQADYPSAIVSAEEAVKRDGTSQEARSVAIVASLRIAIKSLTELRGEQNLGSNAQAEAQRLAALLRDSLSTDLLVPPEPAPEPAKKSVKRPVHKPPATTAAAPDVPKPAVEKPAKPVDSSDPFGALRN